MGRSNPGDVAKTCVPLIVNAQKGRFLRRIWPFLDGIKTEKRLTIWISNMLENAIRAALFSLTVRLAALRQALRRKQVWPEFAKALANDTFNIIGRLAAETFFGNCARLS